MKKKILAMKKKLMLWGIGIFAVFSLAFADGYFEISKNLDIFATVVRELNNYYVDEIKPGELMTRGIDGMLESLDPYTEYYPESEVEDYKVMLTGQYGGIGALVQERGDYVMISEPYEGFPAMKAGLIAGDIILEVNGTSVKGKTTNDVSKLLKGQANTSVRVLIKREGEPSPFEKTLVREEIKIKNVPYSGMVTDSIGYIKLSGFTENAAKEVKDAFLNLRDKQGMKFLIFDLRGNGGGLLRESVEIVNLFVDKGSLIVSQKGKIKEMNREHVADKAPVDAKMPIVVLIDKGSASASEIVSGAIQDLDRGIVIGQRSFGKGLVQQTIQLVYNTQMKVTTAKYYTPSGRCIQALDYFHKNPDGKVEKVPDSLMQEYKTKGGRFVYDGSGIYPDIFMEPRKIGPITSTLVSKNHIFDYATGFRIKNPGIPDASKFRFSDEMYNEFLTFMKTRDFDYSTKSEKLLVELKQTTEEEKYFDGIQSEYDALLKKISHDKDADLQKFKPEISQFLEAEIAARYYFQQGRLKATQKTDPELKEAIRILQNKSLYASILKGDGNYKTIGKPGTGLDNKNKPGSSSNDPGKKDENPGSKNEKEKEKDRKKKKG
jgi:carboxyl-terminal processing protease